MAIDDLYTKSLLHMDGVDTSTTFTDESGKTWTARGTAQIDTAQSVFGGASGLFDGNSDWIDTPDHADWQLDGGADANLWTIDTRIRFNGDPSGTNNAVCGQYVDADNYWAFRFTSGDNLRFIIRSSASTIVSIDKAWNPADATWYHLAIVKNGTTGYSYYVDGTEIGTPTTDTDPMPDFAAILTVGKETTAGAHYLNGWLDEFRISKGVARWTTNFTPPVRAYGGGGGLMLFSS